METKGLYALTNGSDVKRLQLMSKEEVAGKQKTIELTTYSWTDDNKAKGYNWQEVKSLALDQLQAIWGGEFNLPPFAWGDWVRDIDDKSTPGYIIGMRWQPPLYRSEWELEELKNLNTVENWQEPELVGNPSTIGWWYQVVFNNQVKEYFADYLIAVDPANYPLIKAANIRVYPFTLGLDNDYYFEITVIPVIENNEQRMTRMSLSFQPQYYRYSVDRLVGSPERKEPFLRDTPGAATESATVMEAQERISREVSNRFY